MMRLALCCIIVVWVTAGAVGWMDAWRVNFRFLLGIDPALASIEAKHIARPALMLSIVWLSTACCYLLDVKYLLVLLPDRLPNRDPSLPAMDEDRERIEILRLFGHRLLLYPFIIWSSIFYFVFKPSNVMRQKYKRNILLVFVSCLLVHPSSQVTFLHNVAGDILTSLAKPFIDVANISCFLTHRIESIAAHLFPSVVDFLSSHFSPAPSNSLMRQEESDVSPTSNIFVVPTALPTLPSSSSHALKAVTDPVTCSSLSWLRPLITLIPFYIRFMQCFARYLATPAPAANPSQLNTLSMADMNTRKGRNNAEQHGLPPHGTSSRSADGHSMTSTAVASSVASVHLFNMGKYASSMIVILAGFVRWEQLGIGAHGGLLIYVLSYLVATVYSYFWDITKDWGLACTPDSFLRDRSLYPAQFYIVSSVLNLIGRLSWTFTLAPPVSLGWRGVKGYRAALNSEILIFIISVVEICRRALWTTLRIENEHLTNAGRYRAMLWVPQLAKGVKKVRVDEEDEDGQGGRQSDDLLIPPDQGLDDLLIEKKTFNNDTNDEYLGSHNLLSSSLLQKSQYNTNNNGSRRVQNSPAAGDSASSPSQQTMLNNSSSQQRVQQLVSPSSRSPAAVSKTALGGGSTSQRNYNNNNANQAVVDSGFLMASLPRMNDEQKKKNVMRMKN
eukprot:GDKJ01045794.1.p1 GENE.GDKJ01045794.1~~GDKJ01045794.1.p1  ORF type:complete len:671 (+),score=158.42 GDKJ01045794.1:2-2014(+)